MTVAVAVETPKGAWCATDSALSLGDGAGAIEIRLPSPKWFDIPGGLVMHAGDYAPLSWLRTRDAPGLGALALDGVERWLVKRWEPILADARDQVARWSTTEDKEYHLSLSLIFVVRGQVWCWDADGGGFMRAPEMAVGNGDSVAFGALHATRGQPARQRVIAAVEAASDLVPGVAGPVHCRFVSSKRSR